MVFSLSGFVIAGLPVPLGARTPPVTHIMPTERPGAKELREKVAPRTTEETGHQPEAPARDSRNFNPRWRFGLVSCSPEGVRLNVRRNGRDPAPALASSGLRRSGTASRTRSRGEPSGHAPAPAP